MRKFVLIPLMLCAAQGALALTEDARPGDVASIGDRAPRIDVLCASYLTNAHLAGQRRTGAEVARDLRGPIRAVGQTAMTEGAKAGWWARFKFLFTTMDEYSEEHMGLQASNLDQITSPLLRRNLARAIQYRLRSLATDARTTPDAAAPLSHVLRGRADIIKFLVSVRAGAERLHRELTERTESELAELAAAKSRLPEETRLKMRDRLTDPWRALVLAGYAGLSLGATAWMVPHAGPLTPAFALTLGVGWWAVRDQLYLGVQRVRLTIKAFVSSRRLDARAARLRAGEASAERAHLELEAIADILKLVNAAEVKDSTFAVYTHTVDLPIPLAQEYIDDEPLGPKVLIDAIMNGHLPFIGGRRAQLSHTLHFENGTPVLTTLLHEHIQPGIADLYLLRTL